MTKKTKGQSTAVAATPRAYVGPTILGVATKGEVYTNGLPDSLVAAAEANPLINKLIVDLDEMPNAQRDILLKRGVYYAAYKSI